MIKLQFAVTFEIDTMLFFTLVKRKQLQRFRKINTIRCHIAHTHTYTHQHMRTKDQTNIWGNVIICLLQMCRDFPRGAVNVNRISRDIITLLRRRRRWRRRKRRRRYFSLTRFESLGGREDGEWPKDISAPQIKFKQTKKRRVADDGACPHLKPTLGRVTEASRSLWKAGMLFTAAAGMAENVCTNAFYFRRNTNKGSFFLFLAPFFLRRAAKEQAKQLADAQLTPQGPEEGSRKISRKAAGWKVASKVFIFFFFFPFCLLSPAILKLV